MLKMFKIKEPDGKMVEIEDGVYKVNAVITLHNGRIIRIDDSTWEAVNAK